MTNNYQANGFYILRNLISESEISEILNTAKEIFRLGMGLSPATDRDFETCLYQYFEKDREGFINCGKQIQHMLALHRLGVSHKIIRELGLPFVNIATRPVMFFNNRRLAEKDVYHTVPAHQDAYSIGGSLDSMVVWIPLINVTKDLGALQVVPGSHAKGLLTSGSLEGFGLVDCFKDEDFITVEMRAGDALFFSSYLVHRSGNNTTDSIRWSAHFRYNSMLDSDFQKRKFPHPYIYKPISKT